MLKPARIQLEERLSFLKLNFTLPVQRDELRDVFFESMILVHGCPLGRLLCTHYLRDKGDPNPHLAVRPV